MQAAIFLISIIFCLFQVDAYTAGDCQQQKCIAVIDAGSTGSRLHMYSYDLDKTSSPINITERWSNKIKPGLAIIEADKATIDSYLDNLFQNAPENPQSVYFYATGGMRLLPLPRQQKIHQFIQKWFQKQHAWQLKNSKTITGAEEGLFGWLTVNYQLDTLADNRKPVGIMDMGGASVQVVFPVKETAVSNNQDIQQLTIYGHPYKLFVHSFLGMGQNEVTHQFLDSKNCFINNYEIPTGESGQGDAYACEQEISPLTNTVHQVKDIVQPVLSANPVNNWYVLGGLVDLATSKPFDFNEGTFTNQELLEKANTQLCQQQWSVIHDQYPDNDYLYGYCVFPAYYYSLIVDGYGIQAQQKLNYLGKNQNTDWTMGVVLYEHAT